MPARQTSSGTWDEGPIWKHPYHPKWLPISPGTIAIDLETVYNKGARTHDFWRASKSLFL